MAKWRLVSKHEFDCASFLAAYRYNWFGFPILLAAGVAFSLLSARAAEFTADGEANREDLGEAMVTAEVAKRLLALHGEVRSQLASDWTGDLPLPPAVERYYQEVGPCNVTIGAHGNPYFLPCLADLWKFQAGYRWNGLSGEPIEDWNDDWFVVADEGGDPFIFERSSGVILHAYHGEGEWDAGEMFPDLNTMVACLAQIGAIVLDAGDDYTEEDCSVRPKYRALASGRLQELLGSKSEAEAVLRVLGWG
jgi:hypothetical protein